MTSTKNDVTVLYSTCPSEAAEKLALLLVESRLAACVNVVPGVRSIYRWEGKIEQEAESLLVIKCPSRGVEEATRTLAREHPYDVPEIIAVAVTGGNAAYLQWVLDNTGR